MARGPEGEFERHVAEQALRTLCANLMRIVAGAGSPGSVAREVVEFLNAEQELLSKRGTYLSGQEIAEALRVESPEPPARDDEPATRERHLYEERRSGEHHLRLDGLRVLAASLLSQDLQMRRRKGDFDDTLRRLIDAREEWLKEVNPARSAVAQKATSGKAGSSPRR